MISPWQSWEKSRISLWTSPRSISSSWGTTAPLRPDPTPFPCTSLWTTTRKPANRIRSPSDPRTLLRKGSTRAGTRWRRSATTRRRTTRRRRGSCTRRRNSRSPVCLRPSLQSFYSNLWILSRSVSVCTAIESVCLSVGLSVGLSVCLPACLPVCLSLSLSLSLLSFPVPSLIQWWLR